MLDLLKKIFNENDFQYDEKNTDDVLFFYKNEKEYYLTSKYTENEFNNFFESKKTRKVIKLFNDLKREYDDIKKNTSLIVVIEVDDIDSFYKKNRNQIFNIEEDEYFFRKYVIMYTSKGIDGIKKENDIILKINQILMDNERMEKFQKNLYSEEEFFIAMQLLVKIPFLKLNKISKKFISIEQKIHDSLKESKLKEDADLILKIIGKENELNLNFEQIRQSIIMEENVEELDELLKLFEVKQ